MDREEPPTADEDGAELPAGSLSALLRQLAADPVGSFEQDWQLGLVSGQRVGRFELLRELGRGGFGIVFEARDTGLGRKVALKALRTGGRAGLRQERLLAEAEAAARLSHPNIVTLHDFGRTEQGPYLVLELLEGQTLAERAAAGALPVEEALRVGTEVARALAHAHERGVVHRDLKPGNVFLCRDGGVKVLDFGLAHAFGHRRASGGTPAYMAPEQWREAPEDERTDIFALGVILFRLLAGRLPFPAEDGGRTVTGPGRAPALEVGGLPELGELVGRMLEKDPVKRPRDGAEVLRALEALRGAAPGEATGGAVRVRRRPGLRLAALVAVGVAIGGGVVGLVGFLRTQAGRVARDRVVVVDATNETQDAELDALSGMLATSLEQSARLDVIPKARLRDLLRNSGRPASSALDESGVQEAAGLASADLVVALKIYRLGVHHVAEARVTERVGGRLRLKVREEASSKESLPAALDRLSELIRLGLGESEADVRASAIEIPYNITPRFDAWDHYARGVACVESHGFAGSYSSCIEELKLAVKADPAFGLARLILSQVSYSEGLPRAKQIDALGDAKDLAARMPRHQRLRLEGWQAFLADDSPRAKDLLARAARAAPDDKLAWWRAGEVIFHRDEYPEAIPFFRRVHELDPGWFLPLEHLITALGNSGDLGGVRELAAQLERGPRTPTGLAALCWSRLWVDPDRAVSACEEAVASGAGSTGDEYLAIALLHRGERDRLRSHLERISKGRKLNTFGAFVGLLLRAQEGRWDEVEAEYAQAGDVQDAWFQAGYAEALAGSGDSSALARAGHRVLAIDPALASHMALHLTALGARGAEEFAPYVPRGSPRDEVHSALRKWRAGRLSEAAIALRAVSAKAPVSADPAGPHPLYLLGELLAETREDAEAARVLSDLARIPLTYPSWQFPRGLLLRAECLERLGDLDGARRVARQLRGLWVNAAPRQPGLERARALWLRLGE